MLVHRLLDLILTEIGLLSTPRSPYSVAETIEKCFCQVDRDIIDEVSRSLPKSSISAVPKIGHAFEQLPSAFCRAGCCVALVVIADGFLFIAHVGCVKYIILKVIYDVS